MAIMAGKAYCTNNLPTGLVPNSNVACLFSIDVLNTLTAKVQKIFHTLLYI